jgi:hypothetical protein
VRIGQALWAFLSVSAGMTRIGSFMNRIKVKFSVFGRFLTNHGWKPSTHPVNPLKGRPRRGREYSEGPSTKTTLNFPLRLT